MAVKKPLRISLIGLGIAVVAVGGFAGWVFYQMRDMHTGPTAQVTDSLYIIDCGMANAYILTAGNQAIAFDAGTNTKAMAEGFSELGLDPAMVTALFLTHSDADHVDGIPLFPNAKVYLSREEVAYLDGRALRHFLFFSRKNTLPVSDYLTLADGDTVTVGSRTVRGILTAGHTVGSMSFLVDDMLFTGDLCLVKDDMVEPMAGFVTESMAGDMEAIRKIASLPGVKYLCTAHTGVCASAESAFAKWH